MNYPKITKIIKSNLENTAVKTLIFEYNKNTIPGQFFMIWIPGIDEIPMSISYNDKKNKGITFKKVGDATEALFKIKKADKIGIRGPYGNGFSIVGKKALFAGGGSGIATIAPAVKEYIKREIHTTVILGVKSKNDLFFENRIKKYGAEVYVTSEDGSKGYTGLATELVEELISKDNYDSVLTCGPEKMMKKIFDICKNISFQASLERYMKCGFGICGQCCVGDGIRVCVEGPVFNGKTLKNIKDFGVFKRNAAGKKIIF